MFGMAILLSNFVRVKGNVSPRPSTLTYPQEIFDRTTLLSVTSIGHLVEITTDPLNIDVLTRIRNPWSVNCTWTITTSQGADYAKLKNLGLIGLR